MGGRENIAKEQHRFLRCSPNSLTYRFLSVTGYRCLIVSLVHVYCVSVGFSPIRLSLSLYVAFSPRSFLVYPSSSRGLTGESCHNLKAGRSLKITNSFKHGRPPDLTKALTIPIDRSRYASLGSGHLLWDCSSFAFICAWLGSFPGS